MEALLGGVLVLIWLVWIFKSGDGPGTLGCMFLIGVAFLILMGLGVWFGIYMSAIMM